MKVSVAMAFYNGKKYIDEQLDSILPQLSPEDEVIISVDGAEDGSASLLKQRAKEDGRIRISAGPGQGVVRNFEHAISLCRGDVIFLCDQDDIWEKRKVKTVLHVLEKTGKTAALHNAALVDSDGIFTEDPDMFTLRKSSTGILKNFIRNSYVGCCMAFRKELVPLILPIPEKMYMHDYWIGTAAELTGGVALVKKPLIRYRRHDSNVTGLSHGSLSFMIKKRLSILICLVTLMKRRKLQWKTIK